MLSNKLIFKEKRTALYKGSHTKNTIRQQGKFRNYSKVFINANTVDSFIFVGIDFRG